MDFMGSNITGWWLIIRLAFMAAASSITSRVMSRQIRARVTSVTLSPTSRPELSKASWLSKGAALFMMSYMSQILAM